MAAFVAPAAAFLAVSSAATPRESNVVPTAAAAPAPVAAAVPHISVVPGPLMSISGWRAVVPERHQALPAGVAPEGGLQVKTILAARAVSAAFPEILTIGGVRPDSLRWHPNGLALDVMIPHYDTAEGKALGDEVLRFVLANADRFGLQHAIWRGVLYGRNGPQGSASGHFDHVHIATVGGGYPTGGEVYFR